MIGDADIVEAVAMIGPAGAGKSTIGLVLAGVLDRAFIDVDEIGSTYYQQVGQPLSEFAEHIAASGFAAAHRWWQPARAAAAAAIDDHPDAVIAYGAGHTHFEDERYVDLIRPAFGCAFVVLLLPSRDPDESISVLRARCLADKGHDWIRDGHDYLAEWTCSSQNLALADLVVHTAGRDSTAVARDIAAAFQHRTSSIG